MSGMTFQSKPSEDRQRIPIMDIDIVGCILMQVCQYVWICMHMYVYVCFYSEAGKRKEDTIVFK